MAGGLWVRRDCTVGTEECQKLRALCRELKKEKDALKESLAREQAVNAELIRRFNLEEHAASTSEVRFKDKKHIEDLERELFSRSQKIAFLQDQLHRRNAENHFADEHKQEHGKNHNTTEKLLKKIKLLEDELVQSESARRLLMNKEHQNDSKLQNLVAQIEKLEAAVSSTQLESQCEIESVKLDMMALEQRCFEAERFSEQVAKEKAQIDVLYKKCSHQLKEAQERIVCLEGINKELHEKMVLSECDIKMLFSKLDDHLDVWLKRNSIVSCQSQLNNVLPTRLENELALWRGRSNEDILRLFLTKLALLASSNENAKYDIQKMPNQFRESERLITQLKEELRNEKLRSKEEAEDLTQAMAELRYQITGMLEEESKRRAIIEQASLQRIQELEAEVQKEKLKSSNAIRQFLKSRELLRSRDMETQHLKHAAEGALESRKDAAAYYLDDAFGDFSFDVEVPATASQACIEWYADECKK